VGALRRYEHILLLSSHQWYVPILSTTLSLSLGLLLSVALLNNNPTVQEQAVKTPAHRSDTIFYSEFETGDLSEWETNQSCPWGVTVVTSPVRSGQHAAKFTVSDSDTNAKCPHVPTGNPRAQLVSRSLFHDGDNCYIGFSTFFPEDFPSTVDWFQVLEIYGPPFSGSPTMEFDVVGNRLAFSRDKTHNYDNPWTSSLPITKGTDWEDLVIHVNFSTDPSVGFVEIWSNGHKQTFKNGTQRLHYETLVPGVNWQERGYNSVFIGQYRSANAQLGAVTLYQDDVRVGPTYSSVAR
jgi:hypothetical protein